MLLRQVHQKSVLFVLFLDKECFNRCESFQSFKRMSVIDVNKLMMSINLNDNAVLNICDTDYCCIINRINKSKAINLLQNANLREKH